MALVTSLAEALATSTGSPKRWLSTETGFEISPSGAVPELLALVKNR